MLALVLVLLGAVPACGGSHRDEGATLLIGVLADFSGASGPGMGPAVKAMEDYLRLEVPASDRPLPGNLKVEFTRFDTGLDYMEVIPGYLELQGRGVKMMVVMSAHDRDILGDTPAADCMPTVGAGGLQSRLSDEWVLTMWSPAQSQAEVGMLFIMQDWDYRGQGRSPRVGHLGYNLLSSMCYQEGIQAVLNANPGRFSWAGFEEAPLGNHDWAPEVARLRDCDYIIVSVTGAMLASFVSQARAGGCAARLITGMEGFPGFWPLVAEAASPERLSGCLFVGWWPWWNEDVPAVRACRDYVARTYRGPQAEELSGTSSVICGWELGIVLEQAIRNALEGAGAGQLDGPALKDGMRAIDVRLEGCLDRWQVAPGSNCLQWSQRAFQYGPAEGCWTPLEGVYQPALTRPPGQAGADGGRPREQLR